ncbi:hypothetical protein [Paraburkholderia pallida]|uniref:Uncharacterized protein n=1 Tax=Paraburkholderia pallida TaxID=2547399 RepID=A0A4P7CTC8_9BURK|nr:hypothetical protein [Paraburkholderia pallida]QBQ99240.1 hypothetical protein E1956_18725 [Paraburkholderia pallida]
MDRIDELLLDWYEWSMGYNAGTDYQAFDSTCAHFRSSRQWMDYDELDAEVEWSRKKSIGRQLEPMIQRLDTRARVAINASMRNFLSGASVWGSARLGDGLSLDAEYGRAKAILCPQMVAVGILDRSVCGSLKNLDDFGISV